MINKINDIIHKESYEIEKIYLLESINKDSGFLFNNNSVWFICRNINNSPGTFINTKYLNMKTNLYITGVTESSYFLKDYYNVIMLKDYSKIDLLDIFVSLCYLFVKKTDEVMFESYFQTLVELFQLESREQSFNNLGLFGELLFIKEMFVKYKINLSSYWHLVSDFDKADITLPTSLIEIKTTIKPEPTFLIKHSQLFNNQQIYIVLIRLHELGNGIDIEDLFDYFKHTEPFNQNLKFLMSLEFLIKKLQISGVDNKKYDLNDINVFYNQDLISLQNIPEHITSITYQFDFSSQKETIFSDFLKVILNDMRT